MIDSLKTKVFLVDDHPMLRMGMSAIINEGADYEVCGEATNAADALRLIQALNPAMAVIDIALESSSGLDLAKQLQAQMPAVRILMVSMFNAEVYAERALKAGAMGYMMKRDAQRNLIEALNCIRGGEIFLSPNQKEKMLLRFLKHSPTISPDDGLSDQELEVLALLGNGFGISEVAERLQLPAEIIRGCREALRKKLNLNEPSDVIGYAIDWTTRRDVSIS